MSAMNSELIIANSCSVPISLFLTKNSTVISQIQHIKPGATWKPQLKREYSVMKLTVVQETDDGTILDTLWSGYIPNAKLGFTNSGLFHAGYKLPQQLLKKNTEKKDWFIWGAVIVAILILIGCVTIFFCKK